MPEGGADGVNKPFTVMLLQVHADGNNFLGGRIAREIHFLSSNVQMERFYH